MNAGQDWWPIEHQAHHEAGHAVTWSLLGARYGFEYVTIRPPLAHIAPSRTGEVDHTAGMTWLVNAAGAIADCAHRGLALDDSAVLCLLTGAGGDRFTATGPGGLVVRPSRTPAVSEGGDLHTMALMMTGDRWPAGEIIRIWRDCERYVTAIMPAVEAVAAKLLVRGRLGPVAVARLARAAMNGTKPPHPEWVSWDLAAWDDWYARTVPWALEEAGTP